jgi:hypothetical protein
VNGIYWYASHQKIEALQPQFGKRGFDWLKELSLTLKSPFAEAKATVSTSRAFYKNILDVEEKLRTSGLVAKFPDVQDKIFFSFRMRAHRTVEHGAYFIVGTQANVALLLTGSPNNAIGAPVKESDLISPSADPLGAIRRAFSELSQEESKSVSRDCSYMWAAIARPIREAWSSLPEVEGIAVYGGRFPAAASQLRRANFADIETIIVASPIFVRQI